MKSVHEATAASPLLSVWISSSGRSGVREQSWRSAEAADREDWGVHCRGVQNYVGGLIPTCVINVRGSESSYGDGARRQLPDVTSTWPRGAISDADYVSRRGATVLRKRILGKHIRWWEDNIKMDLKDRVGAMEGIYLCQFSDRWLALVKTATNFQVP
jgi:hypothetical protein